MAEYDIETDKDRPYRDETILRRLYHDEFLTQKEIADVLDASVDTIWRYMDKFDIKTRDQSEAQVAHPKLLDESWLREKYNGEELSITDVSELLGVSRMPVFRALKRHGIEPHSRGFKVEQIHATYRTNTEGYPHWYSHYNTDDGEQRQQTFRVHRLLAIAEYGTDAVAGSEIHHKNGITWDNRPENIEVLDKDEHAKVHWDERGGLREWQ